MIDWLEQQYNNLLFHIFPILPSYILKEHYEKLNNKRMELTTMSIKKITNDRELYDLCRKYNYFYKQCKEIEELNNKYYNRDIQNAYKKAEKQLNNITLKLLHYIFKTTGALDMVRITPNAPHFEESFFGRIPVQNNSMETIINSKQFADIMQDILQYDVKNNNGARRW